MYTDIYAYISMHVMYINIDIYIEIKYAVVKIFIQPPHTQNIFYTELNQTSSSVDPQVSEASK